MAAAQKFMFGRDFTEEPVKPHRQAEPEPEPTPEPEPEPEDEPTYSAEDLAAARAEGHAQGHAAGLVEGREAAEAEADQAMTQTLERMAAGLETLAASETETRDARDRESLELCVGLLRRLFPALARKHGQREIEQVFQDALERLRDEPRIVVRCADRHLDDLKAKVDDMAARLGFEGRVVLLADEAMPPGDARVEWADGGVERDSQRLWQDVERAMERALAPPAPAAETGAQDGAPESGTRDDGAARSNGDGAAAAASADTTPEPATTPDDGRHA
jgi:flagellar assembly protein FliH